jgi:hypothetical protein
VRHYRIVRIIARKRGELTRLRAKRVGRHPLAIDLLRLVAEDAGLRPSYRVKARQHLRTLRKVARRQAEGDNDPDE